MSTSPVTSISVSYSVALVTVGNLPKNLKLISSIFNSIAEQNIIVDMISQSPPYRDSVSMSFTIPSEDLVKAISILNGFKKDVPSLSVEIDADNVKLSVYGEGMKSLSGVAARLFTVLEGSKVDIKMVTTSEVDISYLVFEKDVDKAVEAIKKEYNLKGT